MFSSKPAGKLIRQYRLVARETESATESSIAVEVASDPAQGVEEISALIIGQARAEAEQILRAARAQSQELRRLAEAEGREAGHTAGRQEALDRAQVAVSDELLRLRQVTGAMIAERSRLLAEAENELVELAIAIARKVVGDVATSQADTILEMARQAIEVLGRPSSCQVHLNPEDAQRIAAQLAGQEGTFAWQLVPDERVAPGGCTITNGVSIVDARPDTQLSLIQQAFANL